MNKLSKIFYFTFSVLFPIHFTNAFVDQGDYSLYNPAGFFSGFWHGLLTVWSLIARWFIDDISMYAFDNTGWFYDLGFIIGTGLSIPIGWIAAIISMIGHLFF